MNKLLILVAFVVGIVLLTDTTTAADQPETFPPQVGMPAPKSLVAGLSSFNDGEGALKTLSRVLRAAEDEENKDNKGGKRQRPGAGDLKALRERLGNRFGKNKGQKGEKEGGEKESN